jgi:hypothetical protein
MFKNLHEVLKSMPDEAACRKYLVEQRWGGAIVCPYCNVQGNVYEIEAVSVSSVVNRLVIRS